MLTQTVYSDFMPDLKSNNSAGKPDVNIKPEALEEEMIKA